MPAHRSHTPMQTPSHPSDTPMDSQTSTDEPSQEATAAPPEVNNSKKHSWIWQHGTELPPKVHHDGSATNVGRLTQREQHAIK